MTSALASCPVCGAANTETARFCSTCGTELRSRRIEEVRKVVTILFADVTGSTALGEQLDPEAMRAIMAQYFAMMKRVIERQAPVGEVLLVLDATTGQNGLVQARIFAEVVQITGIVLTKLDGSAKGGIVVQVQRELGVPVKLVGLGEGVDDLAPFDPEVFVDAMLEPAA